MRIYSNPAEMVREVERELFEMGTRYQTMTVQDQNVENNPDFMTIELNGYSYSLTGFENGKMKEMIDYLKGNHRWIHDEFIERIFPTVPMNPGTAYQVWPDRWVQFLRDGKFAYTYGERWSWQLPYVIDELARRPTSRQAIMTMYDAHQDIMNWGGRDRVPCSISYQFLIRDGKLDLIYNERSCDFMKFFVSDVAITCMLLMHVANILNVGFGKFVHNIGSLHAFAGDLKGRNIF